MLSPQPEASHRETETGLGLPLSVSTWPFQMAESRQMGYLLEVGGGGGGGGVSEGQETNWIQRLCPAVASPRVPEIQQLVCGAQRDGSFHHLQTGPHGTRAPPSLGSRKAQSVCVSATPSVCVCVSHTQQLALSLGRCQCMPPVGSAWFERLCQVWGSVCRPRPCSLQPPRTAFPWLF